MSLEGCPPGRSLGAVHTRDRYECDCDRDNTNILSCEPNGYDVVLKVSSYIRSLQRAVTDDMNACMHVRIYLMLITYN